MLSELSSVKPDISFNTLEKVDITWHYGSKDFVVQKSVYQENILNMEGSECFSSSESHWGLLGEPFVGFLAPEGCVHAHV